MDITSGSDRTQATREQIKTAVRELLAEGGFHASTLLSSYDTYRELREAGLSDSDRQTTTLLQQTARDLLLPP